MLNNTDLTEIDVIDLLVTFVLINWIYSFAVLPIISSFSGLEYFMILEYSVLVAVVFLLAFWKKLDYTTTLIYTLGVLFVRILLLYTDILTIFIAVLGLKILFDLVPDKEET
jgi:hypothetical protein